MSKHNNQGAGGKTDAPEPEKTASAQQAAMAEPAVESAPPENGNAAGENSAKDETRANPAANEKKEKTPEEKIAELEIQVAELNDQYLRKAADFENFRKRMNQEKQNAIEYANQSLLLDLVQTMDDFDRALKSGEALVGESAGPEIKSFYEGVAMIEKRFSSNLENKWGLKRFNSAGEPFDPERHEAMLMDKSPEITEPMVMEEYFKGYTLKDRVVRHAQVKVLMPDQSANAGAKAESGVGGQEASSP